MENSAPRASRSSAAVVGDTLYFTGSESGLYALDIHTGQIKWRYSKQGSVMITAPAVAFDSLFVTSSNRLSAINTSNGEEKWHFEQKEVFLTSPSIVGDVVLCPTLDSVDWSGRRIASGSLYAIYAITGRQIWKLPVVGDIDNTAAIAEGIIYITAADGYLYAIR